MFQPRGRRHLAPPPSSGGGLHLGDDPRGRRESGNDPRPSERRRRQRRRQHERGGRRALLGRFRGVELGARHERGADQPAGGGQGAARLLGNAPIARALLARELASFWARAGANAKTGGGASHAPARSPPGRGLLPQAQCRAARPSGRARSASGAAGRHSRCRCGGGRGGCRGLAAGWQLERRPRPLPPTPNRAQPLHSVGGASHEAERQTLLCSSRVCAGPAADAGRVGQRGAAAVHEQLQRAAQHF